MKRILFLLLFSFCLGKIVAQDTITKRNSEIIIAKILEINPTEIKYKRVDNIDGPLYIINKSEVKMIVYVNGMKELFEEKPIAKTAISISNNDDYVQKKAESNKIDMWSSGKYRQGNHMLNERDAHYLLLQTKDKKIMSLVGQAKDAKGMQYIGFAGIPLGIGAYGLLIASAINGGSSSGPLGIGLNPAYATGSVVCALAAIACPIASGQFKRKRTNCNRAAVKLYNEKF